MSAPKTLYEQNTQLAALISALSDGDLGDASALMYRQHVARVINQAMLELTGEATRGVALDGGQMNAAIQLLQQAKNKALDAVSLGTHAQKRARKEDQ